MSAERTYRRDNETRKVKEKIRAESKAGMYDGPGLGKAKGREMAEKVKAEDKKDMEKYGGMDMASKEQQGKAYGGKVMKMADGKMVKKKKKTTKVARRRGDGCAIKGKTRGRMV
jgi:hypothetical protein